MEADTWTAAAVDQGGDSSSTEDVESPRSVVAAAAARRGSGRWRWWRKSRDGKQEKEKEENSEKKEKAMMLMHSQVVRIKEEEMQISEDLIGDHYSSYGYVADCHSSDNDDVWFRSSLPASPLGSKRSD